MKVAQKKRVMVPVTTTVTTPNTLKSVERLKKPSGGTEKTINAATGERVTSITSDDGLDTVTESTCGPQVETHSALNRKYGYSYIKSSKLISQSGLLLESSVVKDYVDVDLDGLPETVTNTVTSNGKTTTAVHDVVNSTRTVTSPKKRTITSTYDPDTLLTLTSSIQGLFATEYSYFADGKPATISTGTRSISYSYDYQGNLATVTDPQNRLTKFTDYDDLGRLTTSIYVGAFFLCNGGSLCGIRIKDASRGIPLAISRRSIDAVTPKEKRKNRE